LKYIAPNSRDDVCVSGEKSSPSKAREIETIWYDQAKQRGEELPWPRRRYHLTTASTWTGKAAERDGNK
jgi:hypothetical protein